MDTPTTKLAGAAATLVDTAAQTADNAIRNSQGAANRTLDHLAGGVEEARAQTDQALKGLAADARELTRRGVAAVREGTQHLRERTADAAESTVGYIKDEPIKSVLIAAAVGAALMALVTLASRSFANRD